MEFQFMDNNKRRMKLLVILIFSFIEGYAQTGDFYNNQITTHQGQVFSLGQFKGKKILIIVLPVSETVSNSSILSVLDSFNSQYENQIIIIGIPSIDEGYTSDSSAVINNWYQKIGGNGIIYSNGLNSKKTNANQDQIFAWLSHASMNGHFDQDIEGPGQTYLISESGQLYGVISSSVSLTTRILKKMCQVK
jgi:glutathione peroxidase-family protein